ncbi:MAG: hypothetical protein HFH35_13600 [Eubacterium sp.]|nr:hypothetical protein [Eubacterium sp.]
MRGDIGGSAKKVGLRIKELERIYGIEHGGNHGNQYTVAKEKVFPLPNSKDNPKNQKELAEFHGITKQTMNNYMRLANMIPELSNLHDTGIVTKTTALSIMESVRAGTVFNFSENHS